MPAAVVTAPAVTAGAVTLGMVSAQGAPAAAGARPDPEQTARTATQVAAADNPVDVVRDKSLNRSYDRLDGARTVRPQRLKRYTTGNLDLRATPASDASVDGTVASGTMVKATGLAEDGFAEIVWRGERRWVTASYLSAKKPRDPAAMPLSDAPCPDMGVERGLTPRAVRVYRAVCNAFPDVVSYGGLGNRPEHDVGRAIDIMVPSVAEGYKIAEFLRARAGELGLFDVIWRQRIWTPVRSAEGWRGMPDRGSVTANHMDHVHVAVN